MSVAGSQGDPSALGHGGQEQPRQQVMSETIDGEGELEALGAAAGGVPELRTGVEDQHVDRLAVQAIADSTGERADLGQRGEIQRGSCAFPEEPSGARGREHRSRRWRLS
jgi:hypothetical protein